MPKAYTTPYWVNKLSEAALREVDFGILAEMTIRGGASARGVTQRLLSYYEVACDL